MKNIKNFLTFTLILGNIFLPLNLGALSEQTIQNWDLDATVSEYFKEKEDEAELKSENEQVEEEKKASYTEEELKEIFTTVINDLLRTRNTCILKGDEESLKKFYNLDRKTSLWAYESEVIKIKYLKNWAQKQAVTFKDIHSVMHMRKVRQRESNLFGMTFNVATAFTYSYLDTPDVNNTFYLGTSHYVHLLKEGDKYCIVKEWYTDPFADSLNLENIKSEEVKNFILNHEAPHATPDERTQQAVNYAHQYCGIPTGNEIIFKYNPNYENFNPVGGDCANFASQIMHEGGKFKKNTTWNYDKGSATKAWVNAQGFKNYIVHSGRGSYIAKGKYKDIYKDAFLMRPGDFVAYEKKGKIVHISTVTGLDSKGYPLVTCHNTDRLLVPYDLGWSNDNITFHLIDVYY